MHSFQVYQSYHPPVLAQRWMHNLEMRTSMSIKVKRKLHDMRIEVNGLREHAVRSNPLGKQKIDSQTCYFKIYKERNLS